jgi:predicted helicase
MNVTYRMLPNLFPTPEHENLLICVSGVGVTKDFSVIITDVLPDLELIGKSQCFPLYWYEKNENRQSR